MEDLSQASLQAIQDIVKAQVDTLRAESKQERQDEFKTFRAESKQERQEEFKTFRAESKQERQDELRNVTDIVRQEIKASENRVIAHVTAEVTSVVNDGILPQIDNHEERLVKLETSSA